MWTCSDWKIWSEMTKPDNKKISRGISRDMSPEAISRRLRIVSDLRILCLKLGRGKKRERS